jgi:hypothetical protein
MKTVRTFFKCFKRTRHTGPEVQLAFECSKKTNRSQRIIAYYCYPYNNDFYKIFLFIVLWFEIMGDIKEYEWK